MHLEDDSFLLNEREGGWTGRAKAFFRSHPKAIILATVGLLCAVAIIVGVAVGGESKKNPAPRQSVIMMISDGMGPASVTLARTWSGKSLNLDSILIGTVRTLSNDSLVTDSAAGATAYACGKKTYNGGIGVDASGVPCGTVLEAAKAKGMKTGLVVTTRFTDATPGSFSAHSTDRGYEEFIAEQQVTKNIDVLFGGGREFFDNASRTDGRNLIDEFQSKGYTLVTTLQEMQQLTKAPALGFFADYNLPYVIDRQNQQLTSVPSLPQMTAKALELLAKAAGDDGFFLMVEGSQIDLAGHSNDAATQVRETFEYDETLGVILEFARHNAGTTVLSTSDHETGGLTLALQQDTFAYPVYQYIPSRLSSVNASALYMSSEIYSGGDISAVLARWAGVTDLTPGELALLELCKANSSSSVLVANIGKIVSSRAYIGFTTQGHSGIDVNLYGYNLPIHFGGNIDNTEVSTYMQRILDLDVQAITNELKSFDPNPASSARDARSARSAPDGAHSKQTVDPFHR